MNINPIHCPDSGCFWSAHGIPDAYTEARAWHLAAHRAEEHGEPLTVEQVAYATRVGHPLPNAPTTPALPVPVGDQPQPLDDEQRDRQILRAAPKNDDDWDNATWAAWWRHCERVHEAAPSRAALLAEVQRLKARVAELERPAIEAKRNEIRSSYSELIAQCEQDRDHEGAFDVQCRLRDREEQWKREDTTNPQPNPPAGEAS